MLWSCSRPGNGHRGRGRWGRCSRGCRRRRFLPPRCGVRAAVKSATSRKLSSPAVRIWRSCSGEGITTGLGSYCGGFTPVTGLSSNSPSRLASSRIAFRLSKAFAWTARPMPLRSMVWMKPSTALWSKVFIRLAAQQRQHMDVQQRFQVHHRRPAPGPAARPSTRRRTPRTASPRTWRSAPPSPDPAAPPSSRCRSPSNVQSPGPGSRTRTPSPASPPPTGSGSCNGGDTSTTATTDAHTP